MSAGTVDDSLKVCNDLSMLAPGFAIRVSAAIEACQTEGLEAMVFETYRTQELQALYYQRGRTIIPPFKTVTAAQSNLQSWHGFGLAVDVVHRKLFWSPPDGEKWFHAVAKLFAEHECNWGGNWVRRDLPHFQWGRCPPSPSDAVRALLASEGLDAVWKRFGATA